MHLHPRLLVLPDLLTYYGFHCFTLILRNLSHVSLFTIKTPSLFVSLPEVTPITASISVPRLYILKR